MLINKKFCTGCGACFNICPQEAIQMKLHTDGFLYPKINLELCINCGLCKKVCPLENLKIRKKQKTAYAVIHKDEEIRSKSSSGGAFSALAEKVIDEGGVCFGAALVKNNFVRHISCENKEDLGKLRGSKYVQSEISDAYISAKTELETGRKVLFSGTPCQIAGLKQYLNKEYENLLTVDFICHGVPSNALWQSYVKYKEKLNDSKVTAAFFRDKSYGWKNFSMKIEFESGDSKIERVHEDLYLKSFLSNIFLRPSCYNCRFKADNYLSDITLADFWGINKINPAINDDKGLSLVVANTTKADEQLKNVFHVLKSYSINFESCVVGNPSYSRSVSKTLLNSPALKDSVRMDFLKLYKKYCGMTLWNKIKRKLASKLAQ